MYSDYFTVCTVISAITFIRHTIESEVRLRISSYIQCKKGNLKKLSFECWKDFQLTFQHSKMNKSMLFMHVRRKGLLG